MASLRARKSVVGSTPTPPLPTRSAAAGSVGGGGGGNCELRPCGMLVQTRIESDQNRLPPPTIRIRVKYGKVHHEIVISPEATFGELKKLLMGPTGVHHEDQKLFYKDRERDSKEFLDTCGVKNKSKIVLVKDSINQEKRLFQMKRAAKLEKETKAISDVSLEVDKLAAQVGALESVISKGGKVTEAYIVNLIELLMNQLVKLDAVLEGVDATLKTQANNQVKRVQSYVETLDMLKIKNSALPSSSKQQESKCSKESLVLQTKHRQQPQQQSPTGPAVVITTQWETFDSFLPSNDPSPSTASSSSARGSTQPVFPWDLL